MVEQQQGRAAELETELFRTGLVLLAAGGAAWLLYRFFLEAFLPEAPCFFSEIVGIYCPGCGGTRAAEALLHGRLLQALWYHPLVPYGALIGGGFMLTQGIHRLGVRCVRGWRYHNWYLYVAVAILLGNFLLKNVLRLVYGIMM